MPTTPNPTPPVDPVDPDEEDPVDPDGEQEFDPMDVNHDGVVDEFESFINDGTGLHPTATTYSATTIMTSPTYGPTTTVPTPDTYHRHSSLEQVAVLNTYAGDNMPFVDGTTQWGQYTDVGPQADTFIDGSTKKIVWTADFKPRFSWNYTSPLTGAFYKSICPLYVFYNKGNIFVDSTAEYYFFVEIFNDYQAYHGYANYRYGKDGMPAPSWPGMIKVVRSIGGASQRPKERSIYESWFDTTFGSHLTYVAPFTYPSTYIGKATIPTRFRTLAGNESVIPRDEFFAESTRAEKGVPPSFTPGSVPVTASYNFSMRTSLAGMDYSRPWLKAFVGYAAAASSGQQPNQASQAGSRVSPASLILADLSTPSYIGYGNVSQFTGNATWATWFSGWLRTGTPTQMVGWLLNTGAPSAAGFVATPYGFTSLSPTANRVGFGEKYLLTSTNIQAEILSMLYVGGSVGAMGFIYDASVGAYGEVTWLSMI